MKNLIITADDFGVFPAINESVFKAIEDQKVNSVAAFSNYDGRKATKDQPEIKSSVENVKQLQQQFGDRIEIGCHLTITSGKPVTGNDMQFLCNGFGYFSGYNEFSYFKEPAQLKKLETELCEQVKRLEEQAGIKVKHLTNHHNSLCFFEEHFNVYMNVARKFGIPMRSVNIKPVRENNLYIRHVYRRLRDDIPKEERKLMLTFTKKIQEYFDTNSKGIKAPDILESAHYGPVSFYPSWFISLLKGIFAWNKNRQLKNILGEFVGGTNAHLELMLHLGHNNDKDRTNEISKEYPGVDPKYFDSRATELRSILNFDFSSVSGFTRDGWKAL